MAIRKITSSASSHPCGTIAMPIPDYQGWMLPLLRALANGQEQTLRELTQQLADQIGLSEAERQEVLPSGQQTVLANRVQWAKTYLKKAGLVAQPSRGRVHITPEGLAVLAQRPKAIDTEFLKRYPAFLAFYTQVQPTPTEEPLPETPEEALESAHHTLHSALADELLERLKMASPAFFERIVVQLLVAMGYGGSLADAGQAIGRSGDDGIDGLIKEDKLGLDVVCVQAKRWQGTVGRPVVQAFAGSMEGQRARKGVLLTTASFSREAVEYVGRIERKIVLIDGQRLTQLMIEYSIGVTVASTFVVKKLDIDYFVDE
jgi:restriction system protein